MREDVKACVDARVNFFDTYYTVPADVQPEVDSFVQMVTDLGERSTDATAFEAEFVSLGLSDKFNSILPKCSPKAVQVSQEYQDYSANIQKEFKEERKKQFADTLLNDVEESVMMRAESDAMQANRRAMADAGVLDEYTKITNATEDVGRLAGFFKRKFGKK